MKQSPDFIKLYDENILIAVVNLNYMFPVCKEALIHVEYKKIDTFREFYNDIQKNNYIYLLKKEMKQIKKVDIKNKAIKLYIEKFGLWVSHSRNNSSNNNILITSNVSS
jgi:protein AbiQ